MGTAAVSVFNFLACSTVDGRGLFCKLPTGDCNGVACIVVPKQENNNQKGCMVIVATLYCIHRKNLALFVLS